MRRANNQDACVVVLSGDLAAWRKRGHCFTVADGMGAHAAGELASKLAVDNIPHVYHKLLELPPHTALEKAIVDANTLIHSRGQDTPDFHGMGTTSSTLLLLPQGAVVGHVGDSRVYRLREGKLDQLSYDHSLVWELEAVTERTGVALPDKVPKNVITRSLGPQATVQVDLEGPFPVEVDDTYLLCSDGLTGPVTDEEIGAILSCLSLGDATQMLVDLANLRGGPDNITVIGVHVTGPPIAGGEDGQAIDETPAARPVHPAIWIVAALALFGSLVFAATNFMLAAAAALLVAVVTAGAGLVRRLGGPSGTDVSVPSGALGDGPYRSYESQPNETLAASLAEMAEGLRQASDVKKWQLDWPSINVHLQQASEAVEQKDHAAAVAQYSHGLRAILHQLRNNLKSSGDSEIVH